MKIRLLPAVAALVAAVTIQAHATPILCITEVMSNGDTWDWFELTNYGTSPADITGFRMDDDSFNFSASVALHGVTIIEPGESVIFIEGNSSAVATFRSNWSVPDMKVGYYSGSGVGFSSGGDGVVVFTSGGAEIAPRVSFGASTSGTAFYWSHDSSGALATAALGTLTTGTLPGYVTWLNGSTTMRGTPGATVVSGAASYLFWKGGSGMWTAAGGTNWFPLGATNGGPWSGANTAVFNSGSGAVEVLDDVAASALQFAVSGYTLLGPSQITLTEGTVIAAAGTTTLNAALGGTNGLLKSGAGTLVLAVSNNFTGGVSVVEGAVRLGAAQAIPGTSAVTTARFGTFNFDGFGVVVGGLGGLGSFLNIGSTLTIGIPGSSSVRFDGRLSGAGDVIIDSPGTGAQRFDTTGQTRGDGRLKDYTGKTIVRRGMLEVDANGYPDVSGVPVKTSQVILEGDDSARGELRLTMDGGVYEFGSDLPELPVITLAGGTIGNESSESVDLLNDIEVSGTGSVIASRGAGNGVSTFPGEFYLFGNLGGDGVLRKTGAGILFLINSNDFSGTLDVANGTVVVESGASTGSGPVNLLRSEADDTGRLCGRGTVGGNLAVAGELDLLAESGYLTVSGGVTMASGGAMLFHFSGGDSVRVIATGTFTTESGSVIKVSGAPVEGVFPVLLASGGISGASNITVTGLGGTGLSGSASTSGNTLMLEISQATGETYASWSGGAPPQADGNGDGFTALAEYALGASAPGGAFAKPVMGATNMGGTNFLTILATVRTNGIGLSVGGAASTDLDSWSTGGVDFVPTGATNVPAGCEQRLYRTPIAGARKFLKLRFIQD